MKMILQVVMLTLFLLLASADDFCDTLADQYSTFRSQCRARQTVVTTCCDLRLFQPREIPSGVYTIRKGVFDTASVYCDMNVTDDGGWIVIQRNRVNSTTNFNRNWTDYEKGFGDLTGDFWYGLEAMHCLTQKGQWELRVDFQFLNKTRSYIHYTLFRVDTSALGYRLFVGGYSGIAPNWLNTNHVRHFSTADDDNDSNRTVNCAARLRSGFWYSNCGLAYPNAQPPYLAGDKLFVEMKIRPRNCEFIPPPPVRAH